MPQVNYGGLTGIKKNMEKQSRGAAPNPEVYRIETHPDQFWATKKPLPS